MVAFTSAIILWTIGKAKEGVVYRALADAIRSECNLAVCHWWGVPLRR